MHEPVASDYDRRFMFSIVLLGFFIGIKHAVEPDHVAAVASLATRSRSVPETVQMSAFWGLGHALTLLCCGSAMLLLDRMVPERAAHALEFIVGGMLVFLGAEVLRRLITRKPHWHVHEHEGGIRHFYAHSHAGEERRHAHDPLHHHHAHPAGSERLRWRALLVGTMHGMAGSAALILLASETTHSLAQGLGILAMFGLGSILGMAMLSMVIAMPLRHSAGHLTWAHRGLEAMIGAVTLGLGIVVMLRSGWGG